MEYSLKRVWNWLSQSTVCVPYSARQLHNCATGKTGYGGVRGEGGKEERRREGEHSLSFSSALECLLVTVTTLSMQPTTGRKGEGREGRGERRLRG